jgi:hypothetical protein
MTTLIMRRHPGKHRPDSRPDMVPWADLRARITGFAPTADPLPPHPGADKHYAEDLKNMPLVTWADITKEAQRDA